MTDEHASIWGKFTPADLRALATEMETMEGMLVGLEQAGHSMEGYTLGLKVEALRVGTKFNSPHLQLTRLIREVREFVNATMNQPGVDVPDCRIDTTSYHLTRQTQGSWHNWRDLFQSNRTRHTVVDAVRLNEKKRNGVYYWIGFVDVPIDGSWPWVPTTGNGVWYGWPPPQDTVRRVFVRSSTKLETPPTEWEVG